MASPVPLDKVVIGNTTIVRAVTTGLRLLTPGINHLDGVLAKVEPATLRYRLLHAAVRLIKRSRHLILRVPQTWPWAQAFADALNRVRVIP